MRCDALISPFCTGSVSGCSAKRRAYYEYYTCITIRTRTEDSELQMHWCLHLVLRRRRRHVLVDPRMFSVFLVQRSAAGHLPATYQRDPWQSNIAKGPGEAVMIIVG